MQKVNKEALDNRPPAEIVMKQSFVAQPGNAKKGEKVDRRDAKLAMAHIYVAMVALLLGGLAGLVQVMVRSGQFELPWGINYYQVLTVHGILLGLILTTFFIFGFQISAISRTSGTLSDKQRLSGWIGFWVMTLGTTMAAVMVLLNEASVLYTFYAPLMAHWIFYLGLAFVVVGSWIGGFAQIARYMQWKRENGKQPGPLLSFMVVVNNLMWVICSLGVAIAVLFQFLPWSLGLVDRIDVLMSRTLFWYFGHPLVYFWLLPAYMIWYTVIPKIIGGKIFSDALARLSFLLFLLFSIPVGFHHQLTEPGIDAFWKFLQVVLTFMVVIPSLMTAFAMFATFESVGRAKGATGLFDFFKKLPWGDARFIVPFIGMVAFIPAGAGGLINASNQMNQVIHNTIWVTGHFHLTVATTVILTFFGAMYWLVPHLTGRVLTPQLNRLGIIQGIIWAVGMSIMSGAMHVVGLLGAPRRSNFSTYGGSEQAAEWVPYQIAQAAGGTILFIGIALVLYIFIQLAFFAPKGQQEYPIGEVEEKAQKTPMFLENWKIWITICVALILLAYTIPFMDMLQNGPPGSIGYKLW